MKEILWHGEVNGRVCRIWHDGHTDLINNKGVYERASDSNPIVAQAILRLVEKSNQDTETIDKLRARLWRTGDRLAYER